MIALELSDGLLVREVLNGHEAAFTELIKRYTDRISVSVYSMVRNSEDTCDIVQESFFIAYRDLSELSVPDKFGPWLRGIATNLARRTLQKRERARKLPELLRPNLTSEADPLTLALRRENSLRIRDALSFLSAESLEIMTLYYFCEEKVNSIANILERPVGSIKRILLESRALLRKELIEMAREEFEEYKLTEKQKQRLQKIPEFSRNAPKITIKVLEEKAPDIRASATTKSFLASMRHGEESCYCCYDFPKGMLADICHVKAEGPLDVEGKSAICVDTLRFNSEKNVKWHWLFYYHMEEDFTECLMRQDGSANENLPPARKPKYGSPKTRIIQQGTITPPVGENDGVTVDRSLYQVNIGKKSHKCVRRLAGGGKFIVPWASEPVADCVDEDFFLLDGRQVLHRFYRGEKYSAKGTEADASETYEVLKESGMPSLDFYGDRYYLFYALIPEYAIY